MYCHFIYDGCTQIAQKRAVRKCQSDYPVKRIHEELKIDYLRIERQQSTVKMVYRGLHNLGPPQVIEMFNYYVPNRCLRSENKLIFESNKN